jgi:serine/threonine protein kinase
MYRSKAAPPAAASRSTDVYAFGTLMHEVLTTRVPWAGFSEAERVLALQHGENLDAALLPKDTPPSVAELIARCLALDRAARPRTAELLAVLEQAHENVVSGHFVRKRARACARTLSCVRRR